MGTSPGCTILLSSSAKIVGLYVFLSTHDYTLIQTNGEEIGGNAEGNPVKLLCIPSVEVQLQ